MIKSISIFLFCLAGVFINAQDANDELSIVASASMIADIAKNIAGPDQNIEMIVPIGGDPHLHEPTPSNARMVAGADLVLINGLTFEGWITELIDNSGTQASVVTVTEGIIPLTSQTYKNSADPHAWMNVANALVYAQNIADALIELDPSNASNYNQRLKAYKTELEALDKEIEVAISSIPEQQRILITSHDAFQYYGKRYGIRLEAMMGISTEAQAQTTDITRLNQVIRSQKVPAIFIESTINPKLMKQLAHDNEIAIGGKLYADSLGDKDSPASTYINMLRYNTKTIVSALTQPISKDQIEAGPSTNYTFIILLGVALLLGMGLAIYLLNK